MPEPSLHIPHSWPAGVSLAEVVRWSASEAEQALILFVAATQRKHAGDMAAQLRALRHIVTRLEQFRRMKERQWADAQASNSKQGATSA